MPNMPTSSPTSLPPRPQDDPGYTPCARSSTPSSCVLKSGCPWWRLLPHDFPPWKTVHHYLRTWPKDGTWQRIHAALRERLRVRLKRDPQTSAGVVDSQSLKSTGVGGEERGY